MPVAMERELQEWIDRLSKGDRNALAPLFEHFGGMVFSIALRVLKSRGEAEEIVQETFLEAWRRVSRFSPERASFGAWLATMARTRSIDKLRASKSRSRTLDKHLNDPQEIVASPMDDLEAQRDAQRVRAALKQLPPEQREVIELAFFEGLSQQEICDRTQTPLGTVKTRARLGSRKLAQILRPDSVTRSG